MYKAKFIVQYKESVVDPRAQQTLIALQKISPAVQNFKMGQVFEVELEADSHEEAKELADRFAKELLVNQVMESYTVELEEVSQ